MGGIIMPKIVLIGAGSYVFARDIITDVLKKPSLKDSSISLVDIDPERLDIMTAFTKRLVKQQDLKRGLIQPQIVKKRWTAQIM